LDSTIHLIAHIAGFQLGHGYAFIKTIKADPILVNFYVEDIKSVTWNDEPYGHLVYAEEQKDLALIFVENHKRMKAGLDDVVMGKGN
jgi:hypothetical protein